MPATGRLGTTLGDKTPRRRTTRGRWGIETGALTQVTARGRPSTMCASCHHPHPFVELPSLSTAALPMAPHEGRRPCPWRHRRQGRYSSGGPVSGGRYSRPSTWHGTQQHLTWARRFFDTPPGIGPSSRPSTWHSGAVHGAPCLQATLWGARRHVTGGTDGRDTSHGRDVTRYGGT